MMHQKALLFDDHEVAAQILKTTAPKEQKSLGRQVRGFTQEVWEANRERIVEEGSFFKFKYGKDEGEGKYVLSSILNSRSGESREQTRVPRASQGTCSNASS